MENRTNLNIEIEALYKDDKISIMRLNHPYNDTVKTSLIVREKGREHREIDISNFTEEEQEKILSEIKENTEEAEAS